jgi:hypothetical protein
MIGPILQIQIYDRAQHLLLLVDHHAAIEISINKRPRNQISLTREKMQQHLSFFGNFL